MGGSSEDRVGWLLDDGGCRGRAILFLAASHSRAVSKRDTRNQGRGDTPTARAKRPCSFRTTWRLLALRAPAWTTKAAV